MKHGLNVLLVAVCALAVSALPVIEIRTTDTDGGPSTRLKLLALPILREIAVPDATLYYMTSQHGCSQGVQETEGTTQRSGDDNADAKKPEDNAKINEIPPVAFYV